MLVWFIYILGCIDTPKMATYLCPTLYGWIWEQMYTIRTQPRNFFIFIFIMGMASTRQWHGLGGKKKKRKKKRKEGDFGRKIKNKNRTNVFHVVDCSHHTRSPLVATLSSSFCSSSSFFFFFVFFSLWFVRHCLPAFFIIS